MLVFEHRDYPEAGLQVPAGTVRNGETPRKAVHREAFEETGLSDFKSVRFLGRYKFSMAPYRDEIQDRYVYHLELSRPALSEWLHYETHDGKGPPTAFSLYWLKLGDPGVNLVLGQGEFVWKLREDRLVTRSDG